MTKSVELGDYEDISFSSRKIRHGFIKKVFGIVMCQLILSLGILSLFVYIPAVRQFVVVHPYLVWIALIVHIVIAIVLICWEEARKKYPWNYIILGLFTLNMGFLLGATSARYSADEIFIAVAACIAVCLALILFAMQTKYDFTTFGGILFSVLIIFIIFGLVQLFFPGKVMNMIYSAFGALLFSFYLVYDVQLMMGGNHKYAISPEEYILAALNIYLDIINIFLYMLSLVSGSKSAT
ncbi:protein lifeguard 1-like [Artemia franciscana]|uniref:protein lifeguard 1-like n=1 Tax=Artemia franciscana TaxID=6661 RepID=UPI0032DB733B